MDKKNEYGLLDLHTHEIKMLSDVLSAFDAMNIKYYAIAGTCLGAERHHGFIPWDDDIDLGVERNDFERLIDRLQGEIGHQYDVRQYSIDQTFEDIVLKVFDDRITLIDESTNSSIETHAWIDIFPIDKMPDNIFLKELHYLHMMFWRAIVAASLINTKVDVHRKRNPFIIFVLKTMMLFHTDKLINSYKSMRRLDNVMKKYRYKEFKTRINFLGAYRKREIYDMDVFGEGRKVCFDGIPIIIPEKTDKYLKQMYGDWKSLPEEKDRNHHHSKVVLK